ncbi:hypothetical protein D5018_13080 [Parashewanella curva]|uniref:Nucleoside transporter/FeoB GTPase Gate domain-containing protein n=1 Tax=Parashewanella curva TaxID=2338552 RepID=A0A3L8PVB7_9GAMM|nr:nucleoside recognition domain-containing protein [Parashewanella curva]RLV59276.1 hypothetical protein D5018_13080 [Parashewanella curva]
MLNRIWWYFFVIAFVVILGKVAFGNTSVVSDSVAALFESSKLSADIAIGLVGVLTLWMGLMRVGEKAGMVRFISKYTEPLLAKLMPEVPRGHPAYGSVTMNLTANALGLDNAATPLGLKAMQDLQSINPVKTVASNAQILFLVLNTSSVTLIPVTVFLYRAQQGAAHPADVFLPILIATSASTIAGLTAVSIAQRISLLNTVVLGYAALLVGGLLSIVAYLTTLSATAISEISTVLGNGILLCLIFSFILVAGYRKVALYDEFIEGAKEGFGQSIQLIPYILAMLIAIGLLRASGALEVALQAIAILVSWLGFDTRFVDALPTAIMKPFSGGGARALMLETMQHEGVDSFAGRLVAIIQGSSETTFYVLAVYFGSVGIRNGRHAITCGLTADLASVLAAISVCYWFYG